MSVISHGFQIISNEKVGRFFSTAKGLKTIGYFRALFSNVAINPLQHPSSPAKAEAVEFRVASHRCETVVRAMLVNISADW